jgi:hypothetical protein
MVSDPEYIEEQARERLRMVKKGETMYVFEDPDNAKVSDDAEVSEDVEVSEDSEKE